MFLNKSDKAKSSTLELTMRMQNSIVLRRDWKFQGMYHGTPLKSYLDQEGYKISYYFFFTTVLWLLLSRSHRISSSGHKGECGSTRKSHVLKETVCLKITKEKFTRTFMRSGQVIKNVLGSETSLRQSIKFANAPTIFLYNSN